MGKRAELIEGAIVAPPKAVKRLSGDEFEDHVFARIRKDFPKRFGLNRRAIKFTQKPKYFSRDRNSNITFDASIEHRGKPGDAAFITIVFECKNYRKSVPVDDVEEFKSKLDQCFGKNVKGILVASGAVQQGALDYARSQGIAVIRIVPQRQMQVMAFKLVRGARLRDVVTNIEKDAAKQVIRAITQDDFYSIEVESRSFDLFGIRGRKTYLSMEELLAGLVS